jgi:hypothetical protein
MGDTTIADDLLAGVADALGDLGATRTLRIITTSALDIDSPGEAPTETEEDVSLDSLLFTFDSKYMPEASIIHGGVMAIVSIQDLTDEQIAGIEPGNLLVDTDGTKTFEIVRVEKIEAAGVPVTFILQLKGS